MGGRALVSLGIMPKRIPAQEYYALTDEILNKLSRIYSQDCFTLIPSYRNKTDFGDADILIKKYIQYPRDVILELFGSETVCNDSVYSFAYKGFQVDFIYVDPDVFDVSLAYFSWNDAGNLCGRAYHSLGLRYGHLGLYFVIRHEHIEDTGSNSHILRQVCLSKDPKVILEFAGFNYNEFVDGFDTLEAMFDWVCRGRFFNPDKFKYENLNNTNKTRNSKRVTYRYFLEWLEYNKHKYHICNFHSDKRNYLPIILDAFPSLSDEIQVARKEYFIAKEIKSKFNGSLVMEWTGLSGKNIEQTIKKVMSKFGSPNWKEFVYNNNTNDIKLKFLDLLK